MSSEGPYGRQGFQSNPSGYGASPGSGPAGGGSYTQQPVYGYGAGSVPGGGGYGAPPPPPSSGRYDYNNPYGANVDVSSYEVRFQTHNRNDHDENYKACGHGVFLLFETRILFYTSCNQLMRNLNSIPILLMTKKRLT
jgi:hypothetical protein